MQETQWDVPDNFDSAAADMLRSQIEAESAEEPLQEHNSALEQPAGVSDALTPSEIGADAAETVQPQPSEPILLTATEAEPESDSAPLEPLVVPQEPVVGSPQEPAAAVFEEPSESLVLSPMVKMSWLKGLTAVKLKARKKLSAKNDKLSKLKFFAKSAESTKTTELRKKQQEQEQRKKNDPREVTPLIDFVQLADAMKKAAEMPPQEFENYAQEYFNLNRKGLFGGATTVEKMLTWKKENIRTSLKKMPTRDLETTATQCFKNITGYMGDRSSRKDDGGHAEKVIKTCLSGSEEVRDEIYCQLVKQTNKNPSQESVKKGWQLMSVCAGSFSPSASLLPFLVTHCRGFYTDPAIGKLAKRAVAALVKSSEIGPRRETPLAMEVQAMADLKPVMMRLYYMDGSFTMLPCCSWTTAADLNKMMAFKLGVKDASAFAVYEMTPEFEERHLGAAERILDLVSYWQRLHDEDKDAGKEKTLAAHQTFRLVYKVHHYFDPAVGDDAAAEVFYRQTVYDVVRMRYPSEEDKVFQLAGIQLQAEYGDASTCQASPPLDKGRKSDLRRFLTDDVTRDKKKEERIELGKRLLEEWAKHSGLSRKAAMDMYLTDVRGWDVWGSNFYFVEPKDNPDIPDKVFLAINPQGVLIIDFESKQVLKQYQYASIPTWGHSGSAFVLHVGTLADTTKLYFNSGFGKEMNELVDAYVKYLCDSAVGMGTM